MESMSQSTGLSRQSLSEGSAQYRDRYAEPESRLAARCRDCFDFAVVVPVCAESAAFVDGYRAAAHRAGRLLVIAVLNGRVGAPESVHSSNAECFHELSTRFSLRAVGRGGWIGCDASMALLVVDRFTIDRRFPSRQGVGLARKIGADVALELIVAGRVRHLFVAMVDADTSLPEDYFGRIAAIGPECSAAVFPLWHEPSGQRDIDRATALYEIRLRYFQRGLQWASSPYSFHAVGSTMAVQALCYAQVRGVPARQAGEDFYLLGKLSKLRPLARLRGEPVRLRSRFSDRVPFGTGAESAKLARGDQLELYHPDCFAAVREVTRGLASLVDAVCLSGHPACEHRAPAHRCPDLHQVEALLLRLSPPVHSFLESQGALHVWPRLCEQAPSAAARLRRLHEWFDGFRTLKLIHQVRDHAASSLPWQDAIRLAPFMAEVADDGACLRAARMALLDMERGQPRLVGPTCVPRGCPPDR